MTKQWLKVSDEYEKLQLIADGIVKAKMFVMDELATQADYDREAEIREQLELNRQYGQERSE